MYLALATPPESVRIQTDADWAPLAPNADRSRWTSAAVEVETRVAAGVGERDQRLAITLRAAGVAPARLRLRWRRNVSAVRDLRLLGDAWERGYGDLEWRGLVPERPLPWYVLTFDGTTAHGYGVMTGASALCCWQVDGDGVTLLLDIRCGGVGVAPGERALPAATVVAYRGEAGETPFAVARAFCAALCPAPLLPAQPVYGGNNWYYAYGRSAHDELRADAERIARLAPSDTRAANRPYMVIDDGWQAGRTSEYNGGPWDAGNERFPDMARLAGEMRDQGVRPGIWWRPLLADERTPDAWRLRRPRTQAETTAGGVVLDPSVPEALERVRADARRLTGWGYELLKHDFSTYDLCGLWGPQMGLSPTPDGWAFADRSRTTAEIVRAFYSAIREAAGEALVMGCNTIGHLGAGVCALQRAGDDTSGRSWERTRRMGVNTLAFRMPQHGAFFAVDADCVGLTTGIPWERNRQWLDALARSGAPLFVSLCPDALGPEQTAALRDAFARAAQVQPPAEPLDWLATTCPARWRCGDEERVYDWYAPDGVEDER